MAVQRSERDTAFLDYYRCPAERAGVGTLPGRSDEPGYFRFGEAVAYGRLVGGPRARLEIDLRVAPAPGCLAGGRSSVNTT